MRTIAKEREMRDTNGDPVNFESLPPRIVRNQDLVDVEVSRKQIRINMDAHQSRGSGWQKAEEEWVQRHLGRP